jgi:hypothetical protein
VILIDKLLASGVGFVLRRVADAVDAEMNDEGALRERLMEAEMRLELGEIDEHEFRDVESNLLARMREIRERREAQRGEGERREGRWAVEAVEAVIDAEPEQREDSREPRRRTRARRAAPKRRRRS